MTDAASIHVSVRIKPPSSRSCVTAAPGQEGCLTVEGRNGEAVLDGFSSITGGSDQMEVYDAVAGPLVDRLMEGYSCTLMAYGQTGSGKTHTIFGPPGCLTEATLRGSDNNSARSAPADWGLFPRVALELLASGKGALHASAIEVYQERAYDLLAERLPLAVGTQKVGGKVAAVSRVAPRRPARFPWLRPPLPLCIVPHEDRAAECGRRERTRRAGTRSTSRPASAASATSARSRRSRTARRGSRCARARRPRLSPSSPAARQEARAQVRARAGAKGTQLSVVS